MFEASSEVADTAERQFWSHMTAVACVGDVGHGGSTTPTDFQTQATAVMWLQNCRSAVSATSLLASNTSTIKTRNFLPGGGQSPGAGGGTITTF